MLSARELKVFYGVIQGLKGVDIDIHDREIVTLIGSNGAENLHPQRDRQSGAFHGAGQFSTRIFPQPDASDCA